MISYGMFSVVINGIAIFFLGLFALDYLLARNKDIAPKAFFAGVVCAIALCVLSIPFVTLNHRTDLVGLHIVIAQLMYCLGFCTAICFSVYQFHAMKIESALRKTLTWIYGFLCVTCCGAIFMFTDEQSIFYFKNGVYHRGEYWFVGILYPLILCLVNCIVVLYADIPPRQRLAFAVYCFLVAMGLTLNRFTENLPIVSITTLCSLSVLYINSYTENRMQYYERETELQNSRMEVMISQIQPHFLYNSISAAVALCRIDPEKAATTMSNFGKYLRCNLDSLKRYEPIPFMEEVQHIRAYVELEKTRLDDKLQVEYEFEATSFLIPALTIQPLVENAIQHGIAEAGIEGIVRISTREDEENYYIEVSDNGCGFNPRIGKNDGKPHIGIINVRNRLYKMVGGGLKIESKPGEGTVATVQLPKSRNIKES